MGLNHVGFEMFDSRIKTNYTKSVLIKIGCRTLQCGFSVFPVFR